MIYPIVVFGAPVLREKCREIGPDYPEVKKLIEDMFLTLEEAEGVGLAAPQIGKSIRLFIVDCTPWGEDHPELADYRRCRDCTRACGVRLRSGCVIWTRISSRTTKSSPGCQPG